MFRSAGVPPAVEAASRRLTRRRHNLAPGRLFLLKAEGGTPSGQPAGRRRYDPRLASHPHRP